MLYDSQKKKKMNDTTNKFHYQYEQLVGQLIKFSLSFTYFNLLVFDVGRMFNLSF